LYIAGDWAAAKEVFENTDRFRCSDRTFAKFTRNELEDGPSQALLAVMRSQDFKAPEGWM
jgi:hypothetical protein